ncbi:MAG: LysM peptidoglycan-binding domain-containing protein [bacterium]|nr:LysM peptidoglycan-binding domain-containing protein [bacterium]
MRDGLVKAYLEIENQSVPDPVIPLRFNPTEYQLQKANNFAEIAIPGLESPPIQFIRGSAETLSVEFLVDTSDTLEDVREKYVNKLRDLLRINAELHAPPIVRFVWDTQLFRGVLESLDTTYLLFTPEGIPLRARLTTKMKEYRPVEVQVRESPRNSPDIDKTYVVRRGDTLSGIAAALYRDPSQWRAIATANGIHDPRQVEPGTVLNVPRLR